jgi:hypothetical protein
MVTGRCTWFANNAQVPKVNICTVLRNRNANKTTRSYLRFVDADILIDKYPQAAIYIAEGTTYQLLIEEFKSLNPVKSK